MDVESSQLDYNSLESGTCPYFPSGTFTYALEQATNLVLQNPGRTMRNLNLPPNDGSSGGASPGCYWSPRLGVGFYRPLTI